MGSRVSEQIVWITCYRSTDSLQAPGVSPPAIRKSGSPALSLRWYAFFSYRGFIRLRTREGLKFARDKGKLRGRPPKLSDLQQRELLKMHATGKYSISDIGKLFQGLAAYGVSDHPAG